MEKDLLKTVAVFTAEQNLQRAAKSAAELQTAAEELCREERDFEESMFLAAYDKEGKIVASIRSLLWNRRDVLPLEVIFDCDPRAYLNDTQPVWHIGRFAVRRTEVTGGGFLLKYLMLAVLEDACHDTQGVALAECDLRLVHTVRKLGLEVKELGAAIEYLGSLTVPVLLTHEGIVQFCEGHLHLKDHVPPGIRFERYLYQRRKP